MNNSANHVFIALGSNLGDREKSLLEALQLLSPEVTITSRSHIYETPPWGFKEQPAFLNQVVAGETTLSPHALLKKCKKIEQDLGREKSFQYGPRTIDLDILFYNDEIIDHADLCIPHAQISKRAFVLVPLLDITPDFVHPASKKTIHALVKNIDTNDIQLYKKVLLTEANMLDWGKKTYVMGILNLTPDSFSGDGTLRHEDPIQFAVDQSLQFVRDGADILDIGAESSRPGSQPISTEEEIMRILPVLQAIRSAQIPVVLSIDTYKAETARACLEEGADWINDIWGLQKDPRMAEVVAEFKAPIVLMHNRSQAKSVKRDTRIGASYIGAEYSDFLVEIRSDLEKLAIFGEQSGIAKEKIILDPGIGFGKTIQQNLQLINQVDTIRSLGYPILIGPSRKSFIGKTLNLPVEERLEGTAACIAIGITRGADIIRVHDVRTMARIAQMTDAIVRKN